MNVADLAAALRERLGSRVKLFEPLLRHTSYRIGGPADVFVSVRTTRELEDCVEAAFQARLPWHVIGTASNLLVADAGIEGIVIKMMARGVRFRNGTTPEEMLVVAEAGCVLGALARKAASSGFAGLEWAGTVPGTVGAAIVNNSGAFGSCTADCLVDARLYFPGSGAQTVSPADLDYGYRTSRLKAGGWRAAVVEATLRTKVGDAARLMATLSDMESRRRATQPLGSSVGSIFRNPPDGFAGDLIEQAGLKGRRAGGAEISTLHANFILNRGGASARDVLDLARTTQQVVWERSGIWLVPEIQTLGRWAADDLSSLEAPPTSSVTGAGQVAS